MRREFRTIDTDGSGQIQPVDFRQILKNYNANLSEDEFYHLILYYDKSGHGIVNYNDFIRSFLKDAWWVSTVHVHGEHRDLQVIESPAI